MDPEKRKIVLGIAGASGSIYAKMLLEKLQEMDPPLSEIAVIFSSTARDIWIDEIGRKYLPEGIAREYDNDTYYAPFASGSSRFDTMIICPASMGVIGKISGGISGSLIARTADVMLKEKRRLIIVPREAPYSLIHIDNMKKIALAGASICPASPSFYSKPESIEDLVMTVVDRIIDLAGFHNKSFRWMHND